MIKNLKEMKPVVFFDKKIPLQLMILILVGGFLFSPILNSFSKNIDFQNITSKQNSDSLALENEFVVVYKNNVFLSKNSTQKISYRIITALSDVVIILKRNKIHLKRGEVKVFSKNDPYKILNGEFFEIGIKKDHPIPTLPGKWYEPLKNIVVFQNEEFRIFEERLGPKEDRELHSHLQRVVVRLNNTHLTDPRFYPEGQEGKGIQVPNTIKFAEPVEHVVRNLSDIPVFNIVIEFKGK